MTLTTGMLISGKMSVGIVRSANGVASRISIAITMNVYGRRSARPTIDRLELAAAGSLTGVAPGREKPPPSHGGARKSRARRD
jgi:hypothetical protein